MLAVDTLTDVPAGMRPPTWRWIAALRAASTCTTRLPSFTTLRKLKLPRDGKLLRAATYYATCYVPELGGPTTARTRYPDIYRSTLIFKAGGHYGFWKQAVESMLLTSLEPADIAEFLGIGRDAKLITTYRDLFFDVSAYKDNEASMHLNILAMSARGTGMLPTDDYFGKLTAFSRGFEAYQRMFLSRASGQFTDEDAEWVNNLIKARMGRHAFQIASTCRTEYLTQHLTVIQAGRSMLVAQDMEMDVLSNKAKLEALGAITSTLHRIIDGASEARRDIVDRYADYVDVDWTEAADSGESPG